MIRAIAMLLSIICILPSVHGQDPVHSPPWQRRRGTRVLHTTNAPWHGASSLRATSPASYFRHDESEIFYKYDKFKRDKKARIFKIDWSRRPGKYSWTTRIIFANVICYILQMRKPSITQMGIKLSDKILNGQELWRLITPVFLHGGAAHLFTNCFSLSNVGGDLEKLFGPGRFLATYFLSGIAGNLVSAYQSPNPGLGASGAVFGIIGANLVFLSRHDWLLGRQGQHMQDAMITTIGMNVLYGLMMPMIDNWAHLGGLVGGAAAAYCFGPRLYLMDVPEVGRRYYVDRPFYRLPRSIESFPENVGNQFHKVTKRLKINTRLDNIAPKPWRVPSSHQNNWKRREAPNRSIKPRDIDF